MPKFEFYAKNSSFSHVMAQTAQNELFLAQKLNFGITNQQNTLNSIIIGSYEKFLDPNFWSQGTPLGSLGSGSQEALGLGAC